jgi:hypothetical protein
VAAVRVRTGSLPTDREAIAWPPWPRSWYPVPRGCLSAPKGDRPDQASRLATGSPMATDTAMILASLAMSKTVPGVNGWPGSVGSSRSAVPLIPGLQLPLKQLS